MAPLSLIMIGCAIVGLDMASAHTDTCSEEIARVGALVDQSMGTRSQSLLQRNRSTLSSITNQHRDQRGRPMKMPNLCLRRSRRVPKL